MTEQRQAWTVGGAGVIYQTTRRYELAGFGKPVGLGTKPALLIIDVQYRTVGTAPAPLETAVEEFTTSCGDIGGAAVGQIARLVTTFREKGWPIHVAPKKTYDNGRLGAKVPGIMELPPKATSSCRKLRPPKATSSFPSGIQVPSSAHR